MTSVTTSADCAIVSRYEDASHQNIALLRHAAPCFGLVDVACTAIEKQTSEGQTIVRWRKNGCHMLSRLPPYVWVGFDDDRIPEVRHIHVPARLVRQEI